MFFFLYEGTILQAASLLSSSDLPNFGLKIVLCSFSYTGGQFYRPRPYWVLGNRRFEPVLLCLAHYLGLLWVCSFSYTEGQFERPCPTGPPVVLHVPIKQRQQSSPLLRRTGPQELCKDGPL